MVAQQHRGSIDGGHQQVLAAAIPEIRRQGRAAHIFPGQRAARFLSDFFELSGRRFVGRQIVKQKRLLGVAYAERLPFHLRIHVAVGDENVGPAVIVVIEELHAKTQIGIADGAHARRARKVGELAIAIVVIEIVVIVGKVVLRDVGPAIAIIVGRVDAHAGLFSPVGTVGHACLGTDLGESTLAIVVIEQARRRVVGYVKIEAAVFVVIQPQHAQPVVASGVDAELLRDIGKGAVAIVVVETVAAALQSARPAIDRDAAILAEHAVAELGQVVDIQVHVVGDIEIEVAIVVIIAESRTRSPTIGIGDAGFDGDVGEGAVVVVVVKRRSMEAGNVDVFPAVVIVVADRHTVSPTAKIQARLRRDVGKRTVMVVVIKPRRMALARPVVFDGRAVNQKNIHPSVVVVVERGGATALGFHNVELLPAAASHVKINSSRPRHVNERRWIGRGSLRVRLLCSRRRLRCWNFACRCRVLWRSRLPRSVQYQCHQQDGRRHRDAQVSHRRYR